MRSPWLSLSLTLLVAGVALPWPSPHQAPLRAIVLDGRAASLPAPAPYDGDVASYTLTVSLGADHRTIVGDGTLRWRNRTTHPVRDLWWHLYMNAFATRSTLFMRTGGASGHRGHEPRAAGGIHVTQLETTRGEDLLHGATSDPAVPDDDTQLHTVLATDVAPGADLTVHMHFTTVLPAAFARTGSWRDFVFVGQWFPKIAVLDDDGTWAHFAFHANAEFYADFGRYDVTLEVPHGDVVGASGEATGPVVRVGARDRHRFIAERVHDFAWSAWRHYQETDATIDGVHVHVLSPPGLSSAATRVIHALEAALPWLARRFGGYPYRTLTVVIPPEGAAGVGGMEYPTLITSEATWPASATVRDVEWVTIHEFVHQYFYGLLASNEARWPFLDEGLTEYVTGRVMSDTYGVDRELFEGAGVAFGYWAFEGGTATSADDHETIASPANAFEDGASYGRHVYRRTAAVLRTFEHANGSPLVDAALRQYALRLRFRHPVPRDLFNAFAAVGATSEQIAWLHRALEGPWRVDLRIATVRTRVIAPGRWRVEADVVREGPLAVPVEIACVTEGGGDVREHWDGIATTHTATFVVTAPPREVVIDPGETMTIDRDVWNNHRSLAAMPLDVRSVAPLTLGVQSLVRAVGP